MCKRRKYTKEAGIGPFKKYFERHGCGSVGGPVASYFRDPRFKSSHRQKILMSIFTVNCRKDENIAKRGRDWPIKTSFKRKFSVLNAV